MIKVQNKILFIAACWMICFLVPSLVLGQNAKNRVAILPFQLNAPPDKTYLGEGFRDMLASRLRTEAGVNIVGRDTINKVLQAKGGQVFPEQLGELARSVDAGYMVYGTITALGGGISIDANVYSVYAEPGSVVQHYFTSATSSDKIMFAIDSLAWDILEKNFDKKRPVAQAPVPVQPQPQVKDTQPAFSTAHPDKTFRKSAPQHEGRKFSKTRNVKMELRGFDIGDIDGDGKPELVLADKSSVQVFRWDGTRMNLLAKIEMLVKYPVHAVNIADLNNNGRAEIYISAADQERPGSRAVEWDGQQFVDLFKDVRWYIRPVNVPGMGLVLAGQTAGVLAVEPGIYVLSTVSGKFHIQQKLPIPSDVNLFDFVYADLEGKGKLDLVVIDSSFKLRIMQNGTTVWQSEERYGGTKRFVGGEPPFRGGTSLNEEIDGVGELYKRFYLPSRMLVKDIDHDGADEIIVNRNPESMSTVAMNLIQYPSGTLVGLKWNGIGLDELWSTNKISGYVVNYQVASREMPSDLAPKHDLFVGIIMENESLNPFGSDQTTVAVYPFEFEKTEQ